MQNKINLILSLRVSFICKYLDNYFKPTLQNNEEDVETLLLRQSPFKRLFR